jgi:acetyltransferase-like isoleucine patch superfamily enzyme
MIKKILLNIRREILKKFRPVMVGGYKREVDGVFLPKTRISNATFIDHPKCFNIKDNVFIGHHNFIEASNGITIDTGCQLTNFITLTTHSSHDSIRLYGDSYVGEEMKGYLKGSIHIGAYTFVGPHVTIMPNTKIGKGCLISAYSFVQGQFPDFSIIRGNPAKVVGDTRKRDERLLRTNPELKENYSKWKDIQ